MTSEATYDKKVNLDHNQPPRFKPNEHDKPKEVVMENEPLNILERTTQTKPQQAPIPFPNRLRKEREEAQQRKLEEACTVAMNERCSAVLLNKLPSKEKDPRSFTIPCQVSNLQINNALADLEASISLMPYTMYEKLGLGEPKPTRMNLELADRVGDDEVIFDMDLSMKNPPTKDDECYSVDDLDNTIIEETHKLLENDQLDLFLLKVLENTINRTDLENCSSIIDKFINDSDIDMAIQRIDSINTAYSEEQKTVGADTNKNEHLYSACANEIDEKKPKLKDLPSHLEYAYLHSDECFPIIISSKLFEKKKKSLLQVLEKH
ncbi:hypothetical protein Tco_1172979 [Tanacetum coccineum]